MNAQLKRLLVAVHDILAMGAAFACAQLLRFSFESVPTSANITYEGLMLMGISLIIFRLFGLHRGLWRFASLKDLQTIIIATALAILVFMLLSFMASRAENLPRSVPLLTWFFAVGFLGGPRLFYRSYKEGNLPLRKVLRAQTNHVDNVLLVGNSREADQAIRSYQLERLDAIRVIGIVDYDMSRMGHDVRGVPIVGTIEQLDTIILRARDDMGLSFLLFAGDDSQKERMQQVIEVAAPHKLPVRRIQATTLSGEARPDFRNITLEDLLGRAPVRLDQDNINRLIAGQVVLVTGAGGSIGSEIVRQVAALAPQSLVILDHSEFALFEIEQFLRSRHPELPLTAMIACIRDKDRMEAIFAAHKPALVFHAAALKHVPLVEGNVTEGVLTNILGTQIIADCALRHQAKAMVMISTDKAIKPSSIMGASKRVAEAYCQALDLSGAPTRFITVRFGNVLGSAGSVVPIFRRQIEEGGPVTVTDPEMQRYFMTISEATSLVLQAAAAGLHADNERGRIMVLDMGKPVKVVDLARKMIVLAGLRPDTDIEIVYTGIRPGEKLFEELFDKDEPTIPAKVDGVFVASARLIDLALLTDTMSLLRRAAHDGDDAACRALIATITPELPGVAP